ncbi:GNAT family N-acetyltransferase [Natronolimnobius baerhuensis]|uniref:GNAT family N-acetyltransferase n=1 Tax=Natronolimnobius baerhuensis TaxID=253108 RepID=A0A202EBR5_9EURY|nr:GNAT family N-acetyltransferase [Natronolimnobius baerhuensis]OVE85684.1 GNAT family N-acetyltransferase [Natronolimnobius baerhuensis]
MALATDQDCDQPTQFSRPPRRFTDHEDRSITIDSHADDSEPLVAMYSRFDEESRAQGLPPRQEPRIREWVSLLLEDGLNVVARHGDDVVGHAALVPHDDTSELAIFVHPDYQSAGIGTHLIRGLLGHGQSHGLTHVWLSVARTNRIAMNLYRSAGFETTLRERGEYEMARPL